MSIGMKGLFLAAAIGASATPALAVTSYFDDFSTYGATETLGIQRPADTVFFQNNWFLGSGGDSVDFLTATGAFGQNICPEPFCIDLDGSTNDAARMTTNFTFDAGTYAVTLGLFGRNPLGLDPVREGFGNDSVKVSFGSGGSEVTLFDTGLNAVTAQQNLSGTFFVTITQPLAFNIIARGGDNVGPVLTLVDITAVPLPAAAPLMLAGLGVLGLIARRRRAGA